MKSKNVKIEMLTESFCAVERELEVADKIINMLQTATGGDQFNMHIAKLKEANSEGIQENLIELKLKTIDTKRLLQAVGALEKAVAIKNKILEINNKYNKKATESTEQAGIVLLPPIRELTDG